MLFSRVCAYVLLGSPELGTLPLRDDLTEFCTQRDLRIGVKKYFERERERGGNYSGRGVQSNDGQVYKLAKTG